MLKMLSVDEVFMHSIIVRKCCWVLPRIPLGTMVLLIPSLPPWKNSCRRLWISSVIGHVLMEMTCLCVLVVIFIVIIFIMSVFYITYYYVKMLG